MPAGTRRSGAVRRRGQKGLVLMEIMIVIAIIGMVASVVTVGLMQSLVAAKEDTTAIGIGHTQQALFLWSMRRGRPPTSGEGLTVLKQPELREDAWGQPLLYRAPERPADSPRVWSVGHDGIDGTEDDVFARK